MHQLQVGEIVEGKIKGIKNFGAFVELPSGDVGLVHISQISNDYVENVADHLSDGQDVKVKVLSCEEVAGKKKISLSIRQAVENSNSDRNNRKRDWKNNNRNTFNKKEPQSSNSFEDMMAKFKKESDEKMSDLSQRLDSF